MAGNAGPTILVLARKVPKFPANLDEDGIGANQHLDVVIVQESSIDHLDQGILSENFHDITERWTLTSRESGNQNLNRHDHSKHLPQPTGRWNSVL